MTGGTPHHAHGEPDAEGRYVAELLGRCEFPPAGARVRCGVSGGADSLALMVLAVEAGCDVTAVHVDHGLRPGSELEGDVVAVVAERFGARFERQQVDVAPGPNLEARARAARHRVLGPDAMLGHTADDQAETILLNLMRGSGIEGLSGMRPGHRRPILALRRTDTEALCAHLQLDFVEDPTNTDPVFRRNRVRHELIPLMNSIAERDVVVLLARQAGLLREVADFIDGQADMVDPTDARALRDAPPVIARTVLRHWLRGCSDEMHPPTSAAVERVMEVVENKRVATELQGGYRVARTGQRLRIEPPRSGA